MKFIKTLVKTLKVYILFPILYPKRLKFRKLRDRIGQGPRKETRKETCGAVLFFFDLGAAFAAFWVVWFRSLLYSLAGAVGPGRS